MHSRASPCAPETHASAHRKHRRVDVTNHQTSRIDGPWLTSTTPMHHNLPDPANTTIASERHDMLAGTSNVPVTTTIIGEHHNVPMSTTMCSRPPDGEGSRTLPVLTLPAKSTRMRTQQYAGLSKSKNYLRAPHHALEHQLNVCEHLNSLRATHRAREHHAVLATTRRRGKPDDVGTTTVCEHRPHARTHNSPGPRIQNGGAGRKNIGSRCQSCQVQ